MRTDEQRAAHAARMRASYKARRGEWIASQGGACVLCGSILDLEIDHKDPKQKVRNVGVMFSWTREKREAELAKCQVLCQTCHQKKTTTEVEVPHGGGVRGKHNCRCVPCRLKTNEYLRALKRARRARGLKN